MQLFYYKLGDEIKLDDENGKLVLTLTMFGQIKKIITFPRRPGGMIRALERYEGKYPHGKMIEFRTFDIRGTCHLSGNESIPTPYTLAITTDVEDIFTDAVEEKTAVLSFPEEKFMELLHVMRDFYN